jgi:hypothetical protein
MRPRNEFRVTRNELRYSLLREQGGVRRSKFSVLRALVLAQIALSPAFQF